MGAKGKGSSRMAPGPWSLAVAQKLAGIIDARPGKRTQFAAETGYSTRLSRLLNGERAWYLEDVERVCAGLGLDPVELLEDVVNGLAHPALESVTRYPLLAAADDLDEEPGTDYGARYDGGA